MKLTFEAKMDGIERVQEHLNDLLKSFSRLDEVAVKSSSNITESFKSLSNAIGDLNRLGGGGLASFTRSFTEAGKAVNSFITATHIETLDKFNKQIEVLESKTHKIMQSVDVNKQKLKVAQTSDDAEETSRLQNRVLRGETYLAAHLQKIQLAKLESALQAPVMSGLTNALGMTPITQGAAFAAAPMVLGAAGTAAYAISQYARLPDLSYVQEHQAMMRRRAVDVGALDPRMSLLRQAGVGEYARRGDGQYDAIDVAQRGGSLLGATLLGGAGTALGVAGVVGGAAALTGGTAALTGALALAGPLGWAAIAAGAVGAGAYSYFSGESVEAIAARRRQEMQQRDLEKYGPIVGGAMKVAQMQRQYLEDTEAAFGWENVLDRTQAGIDRGLLPEQYANTSNRLARHGINLNTRSQLAKFTSHYGISEKLVEQMARRGATGGGDEDAVFRLLQGAGISSQASIGARTAFTDATGEVMGRYGAGMNITDVMGATAGAAANMKGAFKSDTERMDVAQNAVDVVRGRAGNPGTLEGSETYVALIQLGVPLSDIPAIAKLPAGSEAQVNAVAIATGRQDKATIRKVLAGALGRANAMIDTLAGDTRAKTEAMAKPVSEGGAGFDIKMYRRTGDMKLSTSGTTAYDAALAAVQAGTAPAGSALPPEVGQGTQAQKEAGKTAESISLALKTYASEEGKSITLALVDAVNNGFQQIVKEVETAVQPYKKEQSKVREEKRVKEQALKNDREDQEFREKHPFWWAFGKMGENIE